MVAVSFKFQVESRNFRIKLKIRVWGMRKFVVCLTLGEVRLGKYRVAPRVRAPLSVESPRRNWAALGKAK